MRRFRFLSLRLAAILTLIASIALSGRVTPLWPESIIIVGYLGLTIVLALQSTMAARLSWSSTLQSVSDAVFVIAVLYESILGISIYDEHGVTSAALMVTFILLSHVGFYASRAQIAIFCTTVLGAWVAFIGAAAMLHERSQPGAFAATFFGPDLGLALSFGFASVGVYLNALAHERASTEVSRLRRRHLNLSRFFSPTIVAELQEGSTALHLRRRDAAVMFVDLRDFSSFAERAPPSELSAVLGEYRKLVAGTVFAFGGTVDKFMGDGVMVVFGQPEPADDDADRALECAFELLEHFAEWKPAALPGNRSFQIGIGIHYGSVVGGVLESGFHDEFTVVGDTVNVAQRLEALCKELDAVLVVSTSLLRRAQPYAGRPWVALKDVLLKGRQQPIDLAAIYDGKPNQRPRAD